MALLLKDTFTFAKDVDLTEELKQLLRNNVAVDIVLYQLSQKINKDDIHNKVYFLKGRTGSGKSTILISKIYNKFKDRNLKVICSQPRVILCKSNVNDLIRYNNYSFGHNIGIITGPDKVYCKSNSCIYYVTSQILNDLLISITQTDDSNIIRSKLSRFKFIVIDEVHVLDLPMLSLLNTCKQILTKFNHYKECPIFIFSSATMNIKKLLNFFNIKDNINDPYLIGYVKGKPNHHVEELWLTNEELNKYIEEEKSDNSYNVIANYFYNNWYKELNKSTSYITVNDKQIQCKDVLIFVPQLLGVNIILNRLKELIKNIPVYIIDNKTTEEELINIRKSENKYILLIGFARGYSYVSTSIIEASINMYDKGVLDRETKIIISTPIIETGKTLSTLYLCIDMGVQTISVYNPLVSNINKPLYCLKQVPINKNQMIQRLGRVGRETEGKYIHFYTKDIFNKFDKYDAPETINNIYLSTLILFSFTKHNLYNFYDFINNNDFLHPMSIDVLIRSINDLIIAGYIDLYGELIDLPVNNESWVAYARYLYVIKKKSLFDSLFTACVKRRNIPLIYNFNNINVDEINTIELKVSDDLIDAIQQTRNMYTLIKYSNVKQKDFVYIKNRDY